MKRDLEIHKVALAIALHLPARVRGAVKLGLFDFEVHLGPGPANEDDWRVNFHLLLPFSELALNMCRVWIGWPKSF